MTKTLRVINQFFTSEVGDLFEYDEDTNMYKSVHKDVFYNNDKKLMSNIKSSFNSEFAISVDYANALIAEGYLEPVSEKEGKDSQFVNIFDEIDNLIAEYGRNLETLDEDTKGLPACIRAERETVLVNLITLLKHLKSLKK